MYFELKPPLSGRLGWIRSSGGTTTASCSAGAPFSLQAGLDEDPEVGDAQLDRPLAARDVADRRADQAEEVALDPVAREIVGNAEHEPVVIEVDALRLPEPRSVGRVVQCTSEPTSYLAPQALRSQLDLVLHPCCPAPPLVNAERRAYQPAKSLQISRFCRDKAEPENPSTAVDKHGGNSLLPLRCVALACGQSGGRPAAILRRSRAPRRGIFRKSSPDSTR